MSVATDLFHTLFESADEAILLTVNGRLVESNASAQELFEHSQQELAGTTLLQLSPPTQPDGRDSAQTLSSIIADALLGEQMDFDWQFQRQDGSTFVAHVTLDAIRAIQQTIIRVSLQETAGRTTAQATPQSENPFRRLAEELNDGLTIMDGQQVVFVNDRLSEILGYPKQELLDLSSLSLAAPEEEIRLRTIIQRAGRSKTPINELTFWIVRPDNSRRFIRNRYLFQHDGEQVTGRFIVTTDLTDEDMATQPSQPVRAPAAQQPAAPFETSGWDTAPLAGQGYLFDQEAVRPIAEAELDPAGASASVPLEIGGVQIGRVGVPAGADQPLTATEHELLSGISAQIANALERARLVEQLQTALGESESLYAGSSQVVQAQTMDQVLQAVATTTAIRRLDRAALLLLDRPWETDGPVPQSAATVAVWQKEGDESPPTPVGDFFPLQEHPAAGLIALRQATVVDDIRTDPRVDPNTRKVLVSDLGMVGVIVLPLVTGDQAYGAILAQSRQRLHLRDDELRQITSLVDQATTVVRSQWLLQQAERRAAELGALNAIASTVTQSLELEEMLSVTLDKVMSLTGFTAGLFSIYNQAAGRLELVHHQHLPDRMRQNLELHGLGNTLCELVFHREETLVLGDLNKESPLDSRGMIAVGLHSYAGIPLRHRGQTLGTICLFDTRPRALAGLNIPFLESIGAQIAIGIANARLFAQSQAALAEAENTYRRYLTREWEGFLASVPRIWGYRDTPAGLINTEDIWTPEIEQALAKQETTTQVDQIDPAGVRDRSALALPILLRGQTIGVLDFVREGESGGWSEDEVALVQALADQVAVALENARLLEQSERRAQRERLTSELVGRIHSAGDTRTILTTAAQELGRALGVSRALIQLRPAEQEPAPPDGRDPNEHHQESKQEK